MSRVYKTARGKSVDIDKVKLSNEKVIAVGNMKVNARGDKIGAGGGVTATRNQIMDQIYAVPDAGYSPNDPTTYTEQQMAVNEQKAKELHDLASNLATPANPEQPAPAPSTRGALASSVAKTTSVVQKAAPTPAEQKKANGPSRI
jgi:hypothetical protein